MNRYFGYVRVSTVRQGEHGVSLQEQRDAIATFARRLGFDVVEWFEERETAARAGRRIFTRMLKLLRSGKADGVILHKIDRGARNLKDWTELSTLCEEGFEIRFTNDNLDLRSRGGRLAADIQAVVAADYIRNLREETRKGFYGRLKQGLYPLPAPIGYLDRGKGRAKELDPVRAPLVRQAFEMYSTGQYTLDSLLEAITALGLRNLRNGVLSRNGLSRMLNNPFYLGIIRLTRTGETFQGIHEALISKAVFDAVQDVLHGRTKMRKQTHRYLFARLFTCSDCGYSLTAEAHKGHVYYRCHRRGCSSASVREEVIDLAISRRLSAIRLTDAELIRAKDEVGALTSVWQSEAAALAGACRLELSALRDRLHRLTDAFVDGLIEKALFEDRKAACLLRQKELEDRLSTLTAGDDLIPKRIVKWLELAGSAFIQYESGAHAEKRELVLNATSNRAVSGKSVDLTLTPALQVIAKRAQLTYSTPHRDEVRTFEPLVRELLKLIQEENANPDQMASRKSAARANPKADADDVAA